VRVIEVFLLSRRISFHREFSAALCLGGGAVKRDVEREVRKEPNEGRKERDRWRHIERERGGGGEAEARGTLPSRGWVKRGEFMGRRATGRSDIPTWHGEINITL